MNKFIRSDIETLLINKAECILAVLESRGYTPGKDWDAVREAKQHEG
jgi:hypothetical protein